MLRAKRSEKSDTLTSFSVKSLVFPGHRRADFSEAISSRILRGETYLRSASDFSEFFS